MKYHDFTHFVQDYSYSIISYQLVKPQQLPLTTAGTYWTVAGQRVVICKFTLAIALNAHGSIGIFSKFPEKKDRNGDKEWLRQSNKGTYVGVST